MSPSNPDPVFPSDMGGFHSRDTLIVCSDGPGDTTVRPARPLLLQLALAERQRMIRLKELLDQPPRVEGHLDTPDPNKPDSHAEEPGST
jgi:hypothetical protein